MPIFRTLQSLDPADHTPRYFRSIRTQAGEAEENLRQKNGSRSRTIWIIQREFSSATLWCLPRKTLWTNRGSGLNLPKKPERTTGLTSSFYAP